jgi:hypothetical protein
MKHETGVGTPSSFAKACATCHKAPVPEFVPAVPYLSFPGVAPVVDATCGQCHGGSAGAGATTNGAIYLGLNYLTSWAAGMHSPATTLPPTPGYNDLTVKLLVVTFTDASTDNNGNAQSTLAIRVTWGDGYFSSGVGGAVFSHTYASGGTYNVIHKAEDLGGRVTSETISLTVSPTPVTRKLKVTVFDNQAVPAPMRQATVYLKKKKADGFIQVDEGLTEDAGLITFKGLDDGKNYKIIVSKAGVDFDGTLNAMQDQAKMTDVFPMDMNRTVLVEQGAAATNGPVANPWKGTNGGMTVFTVAP